MCVCVANSGNRGSCIFFWQRQPWSVSPCLSVFIYFFWARLLLCACRLIALVCLVCAGWFRPLTDPGSRHESGLLPYARTGAKNTQVWSATQLCLEERPCGRMQREEPTHRKGDLSPFFFLFACAISSCIITHGCISLQKQLLLQLYAARQIPERGREVAAADTCSTCSMLQEERALSTPSLFHGGGVAGAMGAYTLAALQPQRQAA